MNVRLNSASRASSPAGPVGLGLVAAALLSLVLSLLISLVSASSAQGATERFAPVHRYRHALVFKPRGVEPGSIHRARLRLRLHGRHIRRHVRVRRVRRAVARNGRLWIRKSHNARGGALKVRTKRPAGSNPVSGAGPPPAPPPSPGPGSCTFGAFSGANPPGACWRPYSDASPFNRSVPSSPQLASNSSEIVGRTTGFGPPQKILAGTADTPGDYDHPIYFSQPDDPVYTVHCTESWGTCEVEGMQVRIPAEARAAGGEDAHLAVIDQSGQWEYDFWRVQRKPAAGGQIVIGWGGRTRIGTSDADGLDSNATAAHFGLAAGVIRPAELEAGDIHHALFMLVKCTNGASVWPAGTGTGSRCSDRGLPSQNAPAMGQHFYLDMSDDQIASLSAPAWQTTILRAMARYGMFVADTGGSSWGILLESGSSYTSFGRRDPWATFGERVGAPTWQSPSGNYYVFDMSHAVNWGSKLRVAAPCVAQGSC